MSDALEGEAWVWVGDRFVPADVVAIQASKAAHLTPYLHTLPPDFQEFVPFMLELGVKQRFDARDYST